MRILVDLGHPGHVHLFKNTIKMLIDRGHKILVTIRERENTVKPLVERYGFEYVELYPNAKGHIRKAIAYIKNDLKLLHLSKKWKPDVFLSATSPYAALVSAILDKPHITFESTEDARLIMHLYVPFTDIIITEESFKYDFPQTKHIRVPTWRPLAYLHPKYFKPNEKVLDYLGVGEGERYFIVRFAALDASHDWGSKFDATWERRKCILDILSRYGKVFVSSEINIPNMREDVKSLNIPKEMYLDALAFSSGYVGEGATTARETICFGIPTIFIHPRARKLGYIAYAEKRGFLHAYTSYKEACKEIETEKILLKKTNFLKYAENFVDLHELFLSLIENFKVAIKEYLEDKDKFLSKFVFKNTYQNESNLKGGENIGS